MDFGNLVNKGKQALAGKDGKIDYKEYSEDAKDAYSTYNKTEGLYQEKAKAVYEGYQKDAKEDAAKAGTSTESKAEKTA